MPPRRAGDLDLERYFSAECESHEACLRRELMEELGVEADIAAAGSRVAVRVVAIDEQRAIADATARLLTR